MTMKIKKILSVVLAATMVCGLMLTGCGNNTNTTPTEPTLNIKDVEKNGIQMEDYLILTTKGYDGYAELRFEIDFDRLKADCSKFLMDTTSAERLDEIFAHTYTHMLVKCDNTYNLSNGDKMDILVTVPDELNSLLTVEIHDSEVIYNVKGLEKFDGIDPFKFVGVKYIKLVEVDGEVGYTLNSYVSGPAELPNGGRTTFVMTSNIEDGKAYKLGDTIHLSISENDIKNNKEQYGENIFKATEIDLKLSDVMCYLPTGDNARDIFTYMDEPCSDNVDYATKKMMDSITETETSVERVGMIFYYDNEGKLFEENGEKFYNQLIFIYKITNEAHPEGWYSYMAYNGYMCVGYHLNYGTVKMEKCTGDIYGSHMMDDYRYYHSEDERIYRNSSVPMSFEDNGVKYPGHKDLADTFAAMKANMPVLEKYDHLIVTESLAEFVTEY